jgi:hypothetical protein
MAGSWLGKSMTTHGQSSGHHKKRRWNNAALDWSATVRNGA